MEWDRPFWNQRHFEPKFWLDFGTVHGLKVCIRMKKNRNLQPKVNWAVSIWPQMVANNNVHPSVLRHV
jgi:hypothetical protein